MEEKLCPRNFKIWVAFVMGMTCIVIAIVIFDHVAARTHSGQADVTQQNQDGLTGAIVSAGYTRDESESWLGIEPVDITEDMAKQLDLKISGGVLVSRVIANSPAEQGEVLRGDIIFKFDYRAVRDIDALREVLSKTEPGDRVKIDLFRDREREVVYVELGEKEADSSTSSVMQIAGEAVPNDLRWGLVVSELTDAVRETHDIPGKAKGAFVVRVQPGSASDKAGIEDKDVIESVSRTTVNSLADFFDAVGDAGDSLLLGVYRRGSEIYINVTAVSPFLPRGPLNAEDNEVAMSSAAPPGAGGSPGTLSSVTLSQGYPVAQEGIGMNRPEYVPGYDQTQSGEPDEKTRSLLPKTVILLGASGDDDDEAPVCKRIEELGL